MKSGMKMGPWILITGKLLLSGYLGNSCHGDQIAVSELYNGLFWFWAEHSKVGEDYKMKYENMGFHGNKMLP